MKKTKVSNKWFCKRCGTKNSFLFGLPMGKLGTINICEVCWVGLCYGLKRDVDTYMFNRDKFLEDVGYTKKIQGLLKQDANKSKKI